MRCDDNTMEGDTGCHIPDAANVSTVVSCFVDRSGRATLTRKHLLSQPTLPYDIFGVVAEFLVGKHLFGTLANLNIANHGIHEETLPVLYETVLQDRKGSNECLRLLFSDGAIPNRFTFTK